MTVLVGRNAPDFKASAVLASGEIINDYHFAERAKGKEALVFFYPLDFTFVCPTELIALDKRMAEFQARNVEVIAVSIDSQFTHAAWRNTPVNKGGIGAVKYTMVSDINHSICQAYGVEHPTASVAFRAAVLVDASGLVRSQIINDLPIGRDVDEILRLIDAIQFANKHGEVCPAGWQKGEKAMKPTADGVSSYLSDNADVL